MEEHNPYSSPLKDHQLQQAPPAMIDGSGTYIRQVKPLCICMIVQGALEVVVCLIYFGLAFMVPMFMSNMANQAQGGAPPNPAQAQMVQNMPIILGVVYSAMALIAAAAGLVRIVAGIRGLTFKGYKWGVVSMFLGLLNVGTCYCIPTALGICVWGCIVYFNENVKQAFVMGSQGQSPSEIEAAFSMR